MAQTDTERRKEFGAFMFRKRRELEYKRGKSISQQQIAMEMGLTQSAISSYESGKRLPIGSAVHQIAKVYGPEVYDALDLPRMMPKNKLLSSIVDRFFSMTEEAQQKLADEAEFLADEHNIEASKKTDAKGVKVP